MESKKSNYGKAKTTAIIFSLGFSIVTLGFGCGMGFDSGSWMGELGNKNLSSFVPTLGDEPVIDVKPNAKTVSVVNYDTVLESMVAQTGQSPSQQTIDRFRSRIGMYSESGSVTTVNSSAMLAMTTVAGELCNDLLNTEFAAGRMPASNRFFPMVVNPTGTASSQLTAPVQADIVRRMARSFWQRNEDAEELASISAGVAEVIAAEPNVNARKASLYMCTAMLSSVAGIEI